jgi:hypothetical protein
MLQDKYPAYVMELDGKVRLVCHSFNLEERYVVDFTSARSIYFFNEIDIDGTDIFSCKLVYTDGAKTVLKNEDARAIFQYLRLNQDRAILTIGDAE